MDRLIFTICSLFFFIILFFNEFGLVQNSSNVSIGVVQDFGSDYGKKNWASISLALDDFYAKHVDFSSRIVLHRGDSKNDIVGAASAVIDLIKNNKVQAILGPNTSTETQIVTEICNEIQIPIVSFTASSPSLSSVTTPYFVRATLNDTSQVSAIAAVVKYFGWREVVLVYQDTDFGSGIVPSLIDAFNSIDTRVPYRCVVPSNPSDEWFEAELYKLMSMQTRVFVVHMMTNLGKRLFLKAKELNLMNEGYVWITTDSLTNDLHILDPATPNSMDGVLGVRSYIPRSNAITSFIPRWHTRYARYHPTDPRPADPTVYQFRAYDALWALATAVEKAGQLTNTFEPPASMDNSTDLSRLGISRSGPKLLNAIFNTQFSGLAGDFKLVNGQMLSSNFEIVNLLGKNGTRVVGFWSPEVELVKDLQNVKTIGLKNVTWPGKSNEIPRGWEVPMLGKKLKIGVPIKKGFKEFVNVEIDEFTGRASVTGYSIDIFEAVINNLPYYIPYHYIPFELGWYDDLLIKVPDQKFDAVVGDITILANRSNYVDFTLPYMQSELSMVVLVKENNNNMWIFLRPLTTDLWLASLAFFFFTGFVVWVVEHRSNIEFRGPPVQQMGTIFYFAFSTLVYAHKERLRSNLSRFTVIIWVFVVLILTSSYTASLTSMLTVQQSQPALTDLSVIINKGGNIGIQEGSNVALGILTQQPNFNRTTQLKNYKNSQEFAQALKLGSANGGVDAIFDETPYLNIFLSEHCDDYRMVGRIFRTDGFGFAFPHGSPLVADISRAILKVTQGCMIPSIDRKWFGDQTTCPTDMPSFTSNRLNFKSFGGLFLITGCVSFLALVAFMITFLYKEREELRNAASQTTFWRKIVIWAKHFDGKDLSSCKFKDYGTSVNNAGSSPDNQAVDVKPDNASEGMQSPASVMSIFTNFSYDSPIEECWSSFREEGDGERHVL